MTRLSDSIVLDRIAVVLSGACMLHCLALPVVLTLFPVVQSGLLEETIFHSVMLIFVIPASVVALTLGCRQHRHLETVLLGGSGLLILCFTALFGHDLLGLTGERIVTSIGGLILAIAHILNFRYCRSADCQH